MLLGSTWNAVENHFLGRRGSLTEIEAALGSGLLLATDGSVAPPSQCVDPFLFHVGLTAGRFPSDERSRG